MTPAARLQAAIEILDQIQAGAPVEKSLTGWGRKNRYAGSKDRAAVRDHVFTAIRCRRSHAALGGAQTGRGLILGGLRDANVDPADFFTGEGYAPTALTADEAAAVTPEMDETTRLDMPDWLWDLLRDSLGDQAEPAALALRQRAPIHIRVNTSRQSREAVIAALAEDGILAEALEAAPTALDVTEGARKLRNTSLYQNGIIELQDAASQAVVDFLPLQDGNRVLDFCAGGGGKTLAMADRAAVRLWAHDANFDRMNDLTARAERAGVEVALLSSEDLDIQNPFDLVLCDVPCSGSGSWRRAPEGKWTLTTEGFDELQQVQADILRQAVTHVAPKGTLAYATCSMLRAENDAQIAKFLADHPDWVLVKSQNWNVHNGTDGFFIAVLTRK